MRMINQGSGCLKFHSFIKLKNFSTRPFLLVCMVLLAVLPAWAQAPSLVWSNNIGARAFALDSMNNVYASSGNQIITLNPAGVPQSTNVFCPRPGIVKRDAAGNFYYGGNFDGTQNFGGITLIGGCTNCAFGKYSPGWPSCYLAKYSSSGTLQWVTSFGLNTFSNRVTDFALNSDGTIIVGYDTSGGKGTLGMFSATGSNMWTTTLPGSGFGDNMALKVGSFDGTSGPFLQYRFNTSIRGGFYDNAGNLTWSTTFPPPMWRSLLTGNAEPATGPTNTFYVAGLSGDTFEPQLQNWAGGSLISTQSLGGIEQYILSQDSGGNLYLAGTNGVFSKYDAAGSLVWSTNYGTVIVSLVPDNSGNGIVSFANGAIARFGTSAGVPQFKASRTSGGAGFQLTIVDAPQTVFEVFGSTNLSSWDSLGTVTNFSGEIDFTDSSSTGQVKKFYKAVRVQ